MAELTKCFEDLGQEVDQNSIRRAVVRENMPRYMTLISKDLKEDRDYQKELDYFTLQKKYESNGLPFSFSPNSKAKAQSKNITPNLSVEKIAEMTNENADENLDEAKFKRMGAFGEQPTLPDGSVNLNLVSADDNNTGLESRFEVSPWDENNDQQSLKEQASSITLSKQKVRRKKKKKVKRKVPKYPEAGYRLPCAQEIEEAYWA